MKINKIYSGVLLLTSGAVFTQLINLLFTPLITRIYSPNDYGMLAVYTSIIGSVSFIGSLSYEMAIPIVRNVSKAKQLTILSILFLLCNSIILYLVFLFYGDYVLDILNAPSLNEIAYTIPLGFFAIGIYNIFSQWALRDKDYKTLTKTKFSQSIVQNLVNVSGYLFSSNPLFLILGKVFGQSMGIYTLQKKVKLKKPSLKRMKIVLKEQKNFLFFTTPRRFLSDFSIVMPALVITSIYGIKAAGYFTLANSMIQLPVNVIGSSISSVFYAEAASLGIKKSDEIKKISDDMLKKILFFSVVPLIIVVLSGKYLFGYIFGSQWDNAGILASILSISVFSRLIFKPISNIFDIFSNQKIAFYLSLLRAIFLVLIYLISTKLEIGLNTFVFMYSLSMGLVYFLQYIYAQKILKRNIILYNSDLKNEGT